MSRSARRIERYAPPALVVEGDLAIIGDAFEKVVEGLCQAGLELLGGLSGVGGKTGPLPEVLPYPFPLCGWQEEGLEAAEVLGAFDGQVAGPDLIAHLQEQGAFPAPPVNLAILANQRFEGFRCEVQGVGCGKVWNDTLSARGLFSPPPAPAFELTNIRSLS